MKSVDGMTIISNVCQRIIRTRQKNGAMLGIIIIKHGLINGNAYMIHIMKNANLGIKTIVHQNQVIGSFSMIGMGSIITKNKRILPGYMYYGKPVKKIRKNILGLKKNKINDKNLKSEHARFKKILKNI